MSSSQASHSGEAPQAEGAASLKRSSSKRDEADDSSPSQSAKRAKGSAAPEQLPVLPVPIKLFATNDDEQARHNYASDDEYDDDDEDLRQRHQNHWSRKQCLTLREMLGIGESNDDAMGPIDYLIISNYIINCEFVLDEVPELLSLPRTVVFYGAKDGTSESWRQACTTLDGTCTVDFVCLNPADPARSDTNPLDNRIPYGVHHSKFFLVAYSSGILRVVIHTANLRNHDIHSKTQGAYVQDFYKKTDTSPPSCDFEKTLTNYLETYRYDKEYQWGGTSTETPTTLIQQLQKYDFSTAHVVLIPSTPGYHKLDNSTHVGHYRLRKAIAQYAVDPAEVETTPTTTTTADPIICQFSSIGSLTPLYLQRLQSSMDVGRARHRLRKSTLNNSSTSGADNDDDDGSSTNSNSKPIHLQLVYPTSDEICNSVEGYRGGNSVPGSTKNVSKEFLRPLFRKWSSAVSFMASLNPSTSDLAMSDAERAGTNPLWKGTSVPHIKTYYQLKTEATADDKERATDDTKQGKPKKEPKKNNPAMHWFVLSSHNLSKAAWGDVQNSKKYGEKRLFIRHWELGVFVCPKLLRAKRLVAWTPEEDVLNTPGTVTVPLPYDVEPQPYAETDKPWAVDAQYVRLDIFGRRGATESE